MLEATDTEWAPWTGVNANRQKVARLHAVRHVPARPRLRRQGTGWLRRPTPPSLLPARQLL